MPVKNQKNCIRFQTNCNETLCNLLSKIAQELCFVQARSICNCHGNNLLLLQAQTAREKDPCSANCNCKINGMEQGKNQAHMHTPTRHDEKSTGCCSLVSKAGMRMDVRDASRSGSLAKYLFRTFSKPFALYLGPFSAVKFIRV